MTSLRARFAQQRREQRALQREANRLRRQGGTQMPLMELPKQRGPRRFQKEMEHWRRTRDRVA